MWKDKAKALLVKKEGENRKKAIENLIVFILILVVTIISINTIWKEDNVEEESKENSNNTKLVNTEQNTTLAAETQDNLEERLEEILEKMDGVGKVKVLITYSSSSEVVPMYNETSKNSSTTEEDSGGGTRTIEEEDSSKEVVYTEENGKNVPVTKQIVSPKIEGAIVTATGATNATVKTNIVQAVEAVTGIATHKIQVFEMKS